MVRVVEWCSEDEETRPSAVAVKFGSRSRVAWVDEQNSWLVSLGPTLVAAEMRTLAVAGLVAAGSLLVAFEAQSSMVWMETWRNCMYSAVKRYNSGTLQWWALPSGIVAGIAIGLGVAMNSSSGVIG